MPQLCEIRDLLGYVAECGFAVAADHVHIAAKATDLIDMHGVVKFPGFLQHGALRFREGLLDQVFHRFLIEQKILQGRELLAHPGGGRCTCGKV